MPYSHLTEAYVIHSLRFTSSATCTDLLAAGSAASHFPTCISRGGTWLGFERVIAHTEGRFERVIARTEGERATIVPATRLV